MFLTIEYWADLELWLMQTSALFKTSNIHTDLVIEPIFIFPLRVVDDKLQLLVIVLVNSEQDMFSIVLVGPPWMSATTHDSVYLLFMGKAGNNLMLFFELY